MMPSHWMPCLLHSNWCHRCDYVEFFYGIVHIDFASLPFYSIVILILDYIVLISGSVFSNYHTLSHIRTDNYFQDTVWVCGYIA